MTDANHLHMRHVVRGYETQLLAARRLARLRASRRAAAEEQPDPEAIARKQQEFIHKVAKEMYTTLLYTGTENPVAEQIRQTLGDLLGQEVRFVYPPGKTLHLLLHDDAAQTQLQPVKAAMLTDLWQATMLVIGRSLRDAAPSDQELDADKLSQHDAS